MTPTLRILYLGAALVALALFSVYLPWLEVVRNMAAVLLFGGLLLDYLLLRSAAVPEVSRDIRGSIPVGVWSSVTLEIRNLSERTKSLVVHDHHPANFIPEDMPRVIELPPNQVGRLTYRVRPRSRGDGVFAGVDLLIGSSMGLWQRKCHLSVESRTQVFPNFRAISHYALLATDNRLSQIGVKHRQRRGKGNDFHQLREYRAGDSLRQIDWRAASRYRKLISKEYQDERDQQILFMLDCGRRMRHAEEQGQHLDQALNAVLLLSYVAAGQGDAVGLLAFGGARRWYPPTKGGDVVRRLVSQTYDIEATTEAADYLEAARELMPLQRRRALVVLITNTRDEDSEDLVAAVRLLSRRHLVVVADLREEVLDKILQRPVGDFSGALRFHGVHDYLENRSRNHEMLRHQGAFTLDLLAPQLPVALVNQYFMVKASGRL
ncbi:DUF58 domain-containing protein [Solemya velesiana gill symbiont]|uniref:DUF58 domain-containing protein n=1 Tax=Solemya velesiana gill symbiont TaxID=1918948 RepID=A0A1T2KW03_9GAMM|nr:DUF58 domain-containing protein [Solemya velesiana gill symbiont]OOZ37037.1 hypothetical protein BOW51_04295 [Solemya velesiana gill symbiont]